MNPSSPTPKTGPTLVRDVAPPTSINAEIVNDIPVRNPLAAGTPAAPPTVKTHPNPVSNPAGIPAPATEHKDLGQMFQDVHPAAKQPDAQANHQKADAQPANVVQAPHSSGPIIATIVACLVAAGLTAAAFYIYQKGY